MATDKSGTDTVTRVIWRGIAFFAFLLGFAAFLVGYLLSPSFVVSWPEMERKGDVAAVLFEAENRTGDPIERKVRVSIVVHQAERTHGVKIYDTLGEKMVVIALEPHEKKALRYEFKVTDREPTLPMVELVKHE